jgi:hypothetical protein
VTSYWFALALCAVLLIVLIQLLRRRRIREKYVALWLIVGLGVIVLGAFPGVPATLAQWVGVQLPVNLVFTVGLFFLLIVCIQLSVAVSSLEERTRTLTEEVALLRAQATGPGTVATERALPATATEPGTVTAPADAPGEDQ